MEYGNLKVSWTEEGQLLLTFMSDDGDDIEEQYVLEEESAYELYLVLHEKFEKLRKIVKVSVNSDDSNNES